MSHIYNKYDTNMLPKRIKAARKLRKETQQSLADKLGTQRQAIINWENESNNTLPSLENLVNLCETLDCSLDYLLGSVDILEIEPISKASHYSGISAEIIRYGIENPNFLDCLNFFMHPNNCGELFNCLTLDAWKTFWIESSMKDINEELKELLIKYYNEYISITPFEEVNKQTYKDFLESKFEETKLSFSVCKTTANVKIKGYSENIINQNFYNVKKFSYPTFINYLVEHTFEPLSHRTIIELQKMKLAKFFVKLFTDYLEKE